MKPKAIVYTSVSGHTARYAELLGSMIGLPVYGRKEAKAALERKTPVIYMGSIRNSRVMKYKEAAMRYKVMAVCGVGLCPTGEFLREVRYATVLPDTMPIFTLQGGIDLGKLGCYAKYSLGRLEKRLKKKKKPNPAETELLETLARGGNFVHQNHLADVVKWYTRSFCQ